MTERGRDLTEQRDDRRRVLPRGVDADRQVRAADHARPEADGGPARDLRVGLCHECRATLVSRRDHADAGLVVQRVEHTHEALARHAERVVDTRGDERVDDRAACGDGRRGRHGKLM